MHGHCRVCGIILNAFMSFGRMPSANGFLLPEQIQSEPFFELQPAVCEDCGTFQLIDTQEPAEMFHDHYVYFSRQSVTMKRHFEEFADWVHKNFLKKQNAFVLEIGCNDGAMLENFARIGHRHLGIEPSANVAEVARAHGLSVMTEFFGADLAKTIKSELGSVDAVVAANVISHIPTINDVFRGVYDLLSKNGVFVFEEPYLGAVIEKGSYDQIYDEHVFLHSARTVAKLADRHSLELIDTAILPTHGGSMRYVIGHRNVRSPSSNVAKTIEAELLIGLDRMETFHNFRIRCEESRESLQKLIRSLRSDGFKVAGYGAAAKSTVVLNYCGLGPNDIAYISDSTPIKRGKLTPGMHIPVISPEEFSNSYPDYAVLFAWNHRGEILAKERAFAAQGGLWIEVFPKVTTH